MKMVDLPAAATSLCRQSNTTARTETNVNWNGLIVLKITACNVSKLCWLELCEYSQMI